MGNVIIQYSDRTVVVESAEIVPTKGAQYRIKIAKPPKTQDRKKYKKARERICLPKAVRVQQIKEVIAEQKGLSCREIGLKIGLSGIRVSHLITWEKIQRN